MASMTPLEALRASKVSGGDKSTLTPLEKLRAENKTEPQQSTLGKVGSFLGGLAKSAAVGIIKPVAEVGTNIINAGQEIIGKPDTQPFSGKFLGDVNGLGKLDVTKGIKTNIPTIKKSAGVGAEIASNFVGAGVVKDAAGAVIKPTIKSLVKEGAIGGATYGLGNSAEQNLNLKDTLKNTATGAVTGAVIAPVISRGASYITKKLGASKDLTTDQGIFNYAKKEGGITVDSSGKMPKDGYVVSPSKNTETIIPSKDFKASDITAFKAKYKNELAQPDAHLGIWEDNGNKYLDVSHVKKDLPSALSTGQKADQLAVWDIKNGKSINVPKIETPKPVLTPLEKMMVDSKKAGYEPIVPNSQLPVIDAGITPKSTLPSVQIGDKNATKVAGDFTYEPIKTNTNIPETAIVPTVKNTTRMPSIKGNTPTSEALRINESFVKKGLTEILPEEMAKYNGFNEADQISKVTNYMSNDPTFSQNVANGKVPKDVVPQVAYNSVKNKAIAEGDIETQMLLAKNPITTQRSQAASTLRASQVLNDKELVDPVSLIAKNDANIAKAFENKNGVKLDEVVQKEVKTAIEKKPKLSLKDFISNIPAC